jgi:hypothetical protein
MDNTATPHYISLGDHCAIAEILRDLGMREKSFPFDWIAKANLLANSNIVNNITTIKRLLKTKNATSTTSYFLSNYARENDDSETKVNCKKIWFPHEEGTKEAIFQKYERRFQRFYETITQRERPCIFFMVTRTFYIPPKMMREYIDTLLRYHQDSKIYFFSGNKHAYLERPEYQSYVVFQYIYYDTTKFYHYDYTDFRPNIKKCIEKTFRKENI